MTREEAIKTITRVMNNYHIDTMINRGIDEALSVAIQALKAEPIKHGRWIESWGGKWHSCSVCGGIPPFNFKGEDIITSYCPNCGAKMDGGENGTD